NADGTTFSNDGPNDTEKGKRFCDATRREEQGDSKNGAAKQDFRSFPEDGRHAGSSEGRADEPGNTGPESRSDGFRRSDAESSSPFSKNADRTTFGNDGPNDTEKGKRFCDATRKEEQGESTSGAPRQDFRCPPEDGRQAGSSEGLADESGNTDPESRSDGFRRSDAESHSLFSQNADGTTFDNYEAEPARKPAKRQEKRNIGNRLGKYKI
ncbi:hypothetical protein, partial [uncultured Mailhella sp.]|uniref:hypothetical protein n=1 Tax=uncultured Mailhella sp. TaxID=1981031 RepID=UPI0025DD9153